MKRVLVIEDEPFFAKLLKRSLEKEDLQVEIAGNLDEGLARAQSQEFEVVVSDLYLGGRSALELTAQLRAVQGATKTNTAIVAAPTDNTTRFHEDVAIHRATPISAKSGAKTML